MPCMQEFLQRAKADRPVYISDVRDAFCREGERPCTLLVHLYDNSARRFDLRLPRFATAGQMRSPLREVLRIHDRETAAAAAAVVL